VFVVDVVVVVVERGGTPNPTNDQLLCMIDLRLAVALVVPRQGVALGRSIRGTARIPDPEKPESSRRHR
jgi:hypothetical protein